MIEANKKDFILDGLGCASCASKIEAGVAKLAGVSSAVVNFPTSTLTVHFSDAGLAGRIAVETADIVKLFEPDVVVREKEAAEADRAESRPGEIGALAEAVQQYRGRIWRIGIGAVLYIAALVFKFPYWAELCVYLAGYLIVGGDILLRAGKNILRGQIFDENFLMCVATVGAFAIGEFPEGVAVMLFYQLGELFQDSAVSRSRKSIAALMDIRPDFANLKTGSDVRKVSPADVAVGALILVKPGEKVPLDGMVVEGFSAVDTSALTGEPLPRDVAPGDDILSGSVNKNGLLTVHVTKAFGESTVSKILDLIQNAADKKASTENFITKFARYYTPAVVLSAAAIALILPIITGTDFAGWINRALVFLVVSCPCALVISIPLSFFGGIGSASKKGILIKGGNFLEALTNVDTVVFDKTGTLTKGMFSVTQIMACTETDETALLRYAAHAESFSNHPIALSILKSYGKDVDKSAVTDFEEICGFGVRATVKGAPVLAGNSKLMSREGIPVQVPDALGTAVHVAVDGRYAGYIIISDTLKEDSKKAVHQLRQLGVKRLVMLTGDAKAVGDTIGRDLGLDEVYAELLPDQKVEKLEALYERAPHRGRLVFVGDGINDAPVLARADVGVAMGGLGSDAAIEAADVVLMTDEPSKLAAAIKTAKRTRRIVWQNIVFALGVKAVVLAMGAGGIATIWEAVFADVGVAVLAILNAMRVSSSE